MFTSPKWQKLLVIQIVFNSVNFSSDQTLQKYVTEHSILLLSQNADCSKFKDHAVLVARRLLESPQINADVILQKFARVIAIELIFK